MAAAETPPELGPETRRRIDLSQMGAHRWKANLRILEIDEIKTVPHVPLSHPFVERLIGTTRREFLDHVLSWTARDLERKLAEFQTTRHAVTRR